MAESGLRHPKELDGRAIGPCLTGLALQGGARQGSPRISHAASSCLSAAPKCVLMIESRLGLSVTALIGDQLRVLPDQLAVLRSRY